MFLSKQCRRFSIDTLHFNQRYWKLETIANGMVFYIFVGFTLETYLDFVIAVVHYGDVMSTITSQITSLTIFCSTVFSSTNQRKYQSSASLAFVRGIHRSPVNFSHRRDSNAENDSIWWRHHANTKIMPDFSNEQFPLYSLTLVSNHLPENLYLLISVYM